MNVFGQGNILVETKPSARVCEANKVASEVVQDVLEYSK